ncbi:molybdenum cofactor guanylyltransferase [Microbacterium ulmi]|uniref:NTP transferase domain-containing protein n=1 Tax=Microbacterium ulmi TaxID=179095 RepID=A0A7Y2M490_9MICO|nr:NTP transferase domain-containing protein [Microbacterium ulmi]NII68649.1 molybdopterin-guanine dinucleotide biosynthesis protein A [Microbacterium ulmi]NNH04818.1 NTP transferase domain-containing protein [Microbacterium ulmi]
MTAGRGDATGSGPGELDTVGAILLAGGRATRMGGATKPLLEIDGRSLLARAVAAVAEAGARPVTVAAEVLDPALEVEWVREDPPFGGPAAATIAVLDAWAARGDDPPWTFLLACDLPHVDAAVARLSSDILLLPADTDGICLADPSSRPQWLTGLYRTVALRRGAAALPDRGRGASVQALLDDLAIAVVPAPEGLTADVDTWEDLVRARTEARHPVARTEEDA